MRACGVVGAGAILCWLPLIVFIACAGPVLAHDRSVSYSRWEIEGRTARVSAWLPEQEMVHFLSANAVGPARDRALGTYLSQKLVLHAGTEPCGPVAPRPTVATAGQLGFFWEVRCPEEGKLSLRSDILADTGAPHLHFARVRLPSGESVERLLTDRERSWTLPETATADSHTSLAEFVVLGVEHILTGYDHLVFVLALLVIGSSIGQVAKIVTGFTVAHSITLGLAVLGSLQPDRAAIEALIGLSIALVAAENLWLQSRRSDSAGSDFLLPAVVVVLLLGLATAAFLGTGAVPASALAGLAIFSAAYFRLLAVLEGRAGLRWAIAFLFGLVHGFGFAGALLEVSLPAERLAIALFGFNLGVEVGQLLVVALLWPVFRWVVQWGGGNLQRPVVEACSTAVLAAGVFWFVQRAFG